jgi:hypothetical protein
MRIRLIAVTLAVCAACVFDIPQSPAPAEPQRAEAIDFDVLHAQATAALDALQQSHEHRLASVASTKF